jgi:hypothetical protein
MPPLYQTPPQKAIISRGKNSALQEADQQIGNKERNSQQGGVFNATLNL